MNHENRIYDVIIIGAGLSGLSSGYYLRKAYKDINILIIEAKDRLGGRTQTVDLKCSKDGIKKKWDAGGQWVTDSQTHVTALINEFKLETYKQFDEGINILETNGKLLTYTSHIPTVLSLGALIDIKRMLYTINRNANKISKIEPFLNLNLAKKYDLTNLENFLYKYSFSNVGKSVIAAAVRTVYGLEPSQINTLFGLMYVKSGGSIESLTLTDPNCAQEKRVKGGTQQISQRLLDYILLNNSNKALFTRPVVLVSQDGNLVKVTVLNTITNQEETYKCRKLVSSIPLNQYSTIKFIPQLPSHKCNVFSSCKIGNYMKIVVTYKRAFWKDKGYSGAVVSDCSIVFHKNKIENAPQYGPLSVVYDATDDENEPALVGFVAAQAAVEWLDIDAKIRQNEIIEALKRYFGAEASDFVEYFEKPWSFEPYTGGCPTLNVTSSGIMQDYARATREPFMNIHFCGTESATQWQGYMDGAIESGIRVANEILYDSYRDKAEIQPDYEKTYYYQRDEVKKYRQNHKNDHNHSRLFLFALIILAILIFYSVIFRHLW